LVIGLALGIVSITFFIKAYVNKNRASLNIGYINGPVISFSLKL
jgi:hypothetical protein